MARLYIMCGLPFSGKSTLAKAIARRFGYALIELDEINERRGVGLNGAAISIRQWTESYKQAYLEMEAALADGQTVVYDATNFRRVQRDRLRQSAAKYAADDIVIYVNLPIEVAEGRWRQNRLNPTRYDVRDEDFAQVRDNFQPPRPDEPTLVYDQTIALDDWIETVFLKQD